MKTTIQRIQELVPDVMKLEFGCEVIDEAEMLDWAKRIVFITRKPKNGLTYFKEQDGSLFSTNGLKNIKILGKPITLAVVLLAIEISSNTASNFFFSKDGEVPDERYSVNIGLLRIMYHWNLSKDNFNDQSEETKTFIGGLLGN